jgi:pyruvate-ferredoxin/flavodoxin oxidoreductase
MENAPAGFIAKSAVGAKNVNFGIAGSPLDCTGCGSCAQVCPAKEKALVMKPLATQIHQAELWDYA